MLHLRATPPLAFRVLIVDADAIQRDIIARCVEMLGWTADTAADPADALDRYRARRHHVVVIDAGFPPPDLRQLLDQLRRCHAAPMVIFVAATDARTAVATRRLARGLGLRVAGTLARPIDPYTLHALLLSNPARVAAGPRRSNKIPDAADLEQALANGELQAEYQPKTDLMTGQIAGVEVLPRWHSANFGLIAPDEFTALAEQSGLIKRLTSRILSQAFLACRRWREERPDFRVAINLSPVVLLDPELPRMLDTLLDEHRLPPGALIAEVAETALLAGSPRAVETLHSLNNRGIRVSLDNFGTGCASLASLLSMPFAELKIDRSFVAACRSDPGARKLVRATVCLARELDALVVAEGVGSEAVARLLRDAGCDIGQGRYFGRPMRADLISRSLHELAWSPGQSRRRVPGAVVAREEAFT
jgi:EAL domain-containing protein (putative c-di-GMP-specific phosphodiesterase class I)